MNTKVIVTADENGNIIAVSKNNPEYGQIRVEQVAPVVSNEGWVKISKRSALIHGKVEELKTLDYRNGQVLPGRIVVRESLTPFNTLNPDRDIKVAGTSGVVCRIDDQPIYRKSFYTTNVNAQDELLTHTNSDEIRELQGAMMSLMQNKKKDAVISL